MEDDALKLGRHKNNDSNEEPDHIIGLLLEKDKTCKLS